MKKKKSLFIVVSSYPYGNGESFLENEVKVNAPLFDKIYFIIPESSKIEGVPKKFFVPENGEIIKLDIRVSQLEKLFYFFYVVFSTDFWKELKFINRDFNAQFNFYIFRTISLYFSKGKFFEKELQRVIKEKNVETISIYSYWCTEFTYSLVRLKRRFPDYHIFTRLHGWDLYFERNPNNYLPFRRQILSELDCSYTVSEQGKNYLQNKFKNIPENKIEVSFLGTEVGAFKATPTGKPFVVLSLSFVSKVKRLDKTIDALATINSQPIMWHHIGAGPDEQRMYEYAKEKLASKENIQFTFHGEYSKEEIYRFFQETPIHVLLNTSDSEGLPVSMMEAMSFGIPVIAPAVGGIPEIVEDNVNGYLFVSNKDTLTIANKIEKLASLTETDYQQFRKQAFSTWSEKFDATKNYPLFAKQLTILSYRAYQVCTKCILDTNDYASIQFDDKGVCEICHTYDELSARTVIHGEAGKQKLNSLINAVKKDGNNKEYNCIIGVSGGVDSSYLAYLTKEWGLKPLVVHVDNGWNTELAVSNIDNLLSKLGFDLYTYVIDWDQMRDIQLSFMKANVLDIDLPFDNAFMAVLYDLASKYGIKHILSGHNTATEGYLPPSFTHYKLDSLNIRDIHKKFGTTPLKTLPVIGPFKQIYYEKLKGIQFHSPLDWMEYNKAEVKKIIINDFGWRDYGGKHYENIFTRFYQGYILPEKFKVDKRKSHLSTLICSGQMTKEEALKIIEQPPYPNQELLKTDKDFFIKKFRISNQDFEEYIKAPAVSHLAYRSYINIINSVRPYYRSIKQIFQL